MSNTYTAISRHPLRYLAVLAVGFATLLLVLNASASPRSNFMEGGSLGGDKNIKADAASGFDWANSGTCTNTAGTISCARGGGPFQGGGPPRRRLGASAPPLTAYSTPR